MGECRISDPLAMFLVDLAVDPDLYAQYQQDRAEVINRAKFGLSKDDKVALTENNGAMIRFQLDNIQIQSSAGRARSAAKSRPSTKK